MTVAGASLTVIAASLGAALCFATSSVAKHSSASSGPAVPRLAIPSMWQFIRATVRHPLWLLGILADAGGLALQVTALAIGALSVVQPLLLSALVFAIVLRGLADRRLSLRQLGWAALVTATLAGSLAVTVSGVPVGQPVDTVPAVVAAACGVVAVTCAVGLGTRSSRVALRAGLTGAAAGTIYAATAALLKAVTTVARHGLVPLLTSWQLYVFIVVGATGLIIGQISFRAGPLAVGLPVAATVDPLLSVVIGVAVFDEAFRAGPGHGLVLGVLLVVLVFAVVRLVVAAEGGSADDEPQPEIVGAVP